MKRCPRCHGQLADVQVGMIRVDGCSICGGVWFNNTELGTVAELEAKDLLSLEDQFLPGPNTPSNRGQMVCPECQVAMYVFAFPHVPNVHLDACPNCKGIWADEGELSALYGAMERAGAVPHTPDPRLTAREAISLFNARRCSSCGTVNSAPGLLCGGCGAKLPPYGQALCPNCDLVLHHRTFGAVTVEICGDCTGVWLDAGELSVLVHYRPDELERFQENSRVNSSSTSVMWKPNPTLLCPRCCVGMVQQERAHASGAMLDHCEHCNGVWVGSEQLPALSRYYTEALTRRPLA